MLFGLVIGNPRTLLPGHNHNLMQDVGGVMSSARTYSIIFCINRNLPYSAMMLTKRVFYAERLQIHNLAGEFTNNETCSLE